MTDNRHAQRAHDRAQAFHTGRENAQVDGASGKFAALLLCGLSVALVAAVLAFCVAA